MSVAYECAVDEDDDMDPEFAQLQKKLSQDRRAAKDSPKARLKKAFPFTFAPNVRPLTINDVESCVALENAAFKHAAHRSTPDKIKYRLTTCPELSLGLFCTVYPSQVPSWFTETLGTARPVETGRGDGAVSVLLAHIISSRCLGEVVTDEDMTVPPDWETRGSRRPSLNVGHQEEGRTIALHSLAVVPRMQGCGLGQMIVKAYLQQMMSCGLADRASLICQDYLVAYYERLGFENRGESRAEFGGGGWYNMVLEWAHGKKESK